MKPYNTGTRMSYGTQPSLFDPPASRRTDPPTSAIGAGHANQISGKLKTRMYQAFLNGPKTANEAAAFCVQSYGDHGHESYRKRSGELARDGLIQSSCSARCRVTGHAAEVWEVIA